MKRKRKRLKRRGPKTQAIYDAMREQREAYPYEFGRCVNPECDGKGGMLTVHEITSGQNRMAGFQEPATWLCLCVRCNCDVFTDRTEWPVVKQLALKAMVDPTRYSREKVLEILGWADTAVPEDVVNSVRHSLAALYGDPFGAKQQGVLKP